MAEVKVCTGKWNGVHGSSFTWHNPDTANAVVITKADTRWPFTCSDKGKQDQITVPAGGKVDCGLIDQTGEYHYNSNPCTTQGDPKTVIIT